MSSRMLVFDARRLLRSRATSTLGRDGASKILTRREPEIAHELARIVEAGEIAELRDGGDRHRELHAAECLQGFDHRIEAPWLCLLEQLGLRAMQKLGAFGDGPNVLVEDDLLGPGALHG